MKPELNLWLAVLDRAVRDAEMLLDRAKADPSVMDDHVFYQDYLSLCRYFSSRSERIGGVQWICELVDVHPDKISTRLERDCFVPIDKMIKKRKQQKRLLAVLNKRISTLEENNDAKACDGTKHKENGEAGKAEEENHPASTFVKAESSSKTDRNDTQPVTENQVTDKVMPAIETRKPIKYVAKMIYSAIRFDNEFFDIREKRKNCPVDRSLLGYWKVIDIYGGSEIVSGSKVAPDGYAKTNKGFVRVEQRRK